MNKERHYSQLIDSASEGIPEHDPSWMITLNQYQVAEDLLQISKHHRKLTEHVREGVIGTDNRGHVDYFRNVAVRRYWYNCHLTTRVGTEKFVGSGALIAPRLVLTAAHVLRPTGTSPDSVRVIPGACHEYTTSLPPAGVPSGQVKFPYGEQSTSITRIHSGYVNSDQHRDKFDIGVAVLPDDTLYRRVGGRYGIVAPSNSLLDDLRPGPPYISFGSHGYPGDKPLYSQWTCSGYVLGYDQYTIRTDMDVVAGQSGSPVFVIDGDSFLIFGVVVSESLTGSGTSTHNNFKRIDDNTFGQIQGWMNEFI